MKILFITDNFPPEVNAPAVRTYEHCLEWIKKGADVTIITCAPNFPEGKLYEGYKNKIKQVEWIDGIKVIRVWSYITANEGFVKRVVDYLSFAVSSFFAGLFVKSDIIVATSPQFFTTWSGWALSKLKRKPWIFELRDLWPESIKTVGAIKQSKIIRFLEKIEIGLYKSSDKVIAVTEAFKKNLVSRGIESSKVDVVTNGANLELFRPKKKNEDLVKKLGLERKFVVGYIGTHGMAHNLEFIIKSISKIEDPEIHFLFVGGGAMKKRVVELATEMGLKNATFHDPVAKDEIPKYISVTDAALVPLKKSDTFKTVIPSKIFESCSMGKPIILGVEGQAKEIVESYNAGLSFEPENENELIEIIYRIKSNPELYNKLQEGCFNLANDFDRKKLAGKMYEIIEGVVDKK